MHPAGMLEPEETTCTARMPKGYTWREIIGMKALNEMSPCSEARARRGCPGWGLLVSSRPGGVEGIIPQSVNHLLSIGGGAPQNRHAERPPPNL